MSYAAIWPLSGFAAWLWIMVRHEMTDDWASWVIALLMIFPACVAGPFNWINVILIERDGGIRRNR